VANLYPSLATAGPAASPGSLPTAGGSASYLSDLEAAHAELRRAALALIDDVEPVVDLTSPAREIERAFASVYDAFDGRTDRLTAVREAIAAVARAASSIAKAAELDQTFAVISEHLARARTHLAGADANLAQVRPEPPPEPMDLRASIDVPRLHAIPRASIVPTLKVREPRPAELVASPSPKLPQPKTFDELRRTIDDLKKRSPAIGGKAPPPSSAPPVSPTRVTPAGFTPVVDAAMDKLTFLHARTREHFEEVAMVGLQRAPLLNDAWRGSLRLEQRMLAAIDVIAAMGDAAVKHVPRLLAESPVKDPSRAFATTMVLGCFRGRDALAAAELALLSSERDAAFVDAVGAALKLVPHDFLPLALRSLLRETDPYVRATAIDVLGYRDLAADSELAAAAMDQPRVAARALPYLAYRSSSELDRALNGRSDEGDPELRDALWTAAVLGDRSGALLQLEDALARDGADTAALLLALGGTEREARLLEARARAAPTSGLVTALGWAGAASSIELLIDLLEAGDEVQSAAAWALERITGAGLWEETVVAEEEILVSTPPEPNTGEPGAPRLAQIVSDPRDTPPEPAPETAELPTTKPALWRAYWHNHAHAYEMSARYRRGLPYTPLVSLQELDQGRCTPSERRQLHLELILRTGGFVRFDPHDFVVAQEEAIAAWRPLAQQTRATPGGWVRPTRRAG
jgi:hypothetical protein